MQEPTGNDEGDRYGTELPIWRRRHSPTNGKMSKPRVPRCMGNGGHHGDNFGIGQKMGTLLTQSGVTKCICPPFEENISCQRRSTNVMVLLGLLGDVHKGNFTWNLKAFDESRVC